MAGFDRTRIACLEDESSRDVYVARDADGVQTSGGNSCLELYRVPADPDVKASSTFLKSPKVQGQHYSSTVYASAFLPKHRWVSIGATCVTVFDMERSDSQPVAHLVDDLRKNYNPKSYELFSLGYNETTDLFIVGANSVVTVMDARMFGGGLDPTVASVSTKGYTKSICCPPATCSSMGHLMAFLDCGTVTLIDLRRIDKSIAVPAMRPMHERCDASDDTGAIIHLRGSIFASTVRNRSLKTGCANFALWDAAAEETTPTWVAKVGFSGICYVDADAGLDSFETEEVEERLRFLLEASACCDQALILRGSGSSLSSFRWI